MSAIDEANHSAPARKKIKLNEEVENLATKRTCRIKELTSRLVELSNEYQELNDLDEFHAMVKKLGMKQNHIDNEESCPLLQLPREVFNKCISYLDKSYGFIAPVSKRFQESYNQVFQGNKETATDFRGVSKEAGVYLVESFHETSVTIDDEDLYEFIFGKDFQRLREVSLYREDFTFKDYLVHKVARQGNLDVFRFFFENGYDLLNAQDEDFFLYEKIAENGHLHILQYLKNEYYFFYGFCCSAYGAARGGHIHILQWLKELGCFERVNKRVVKKCAEIAAQCRQLEVLKYFKQNFDFFEDFCLMDEALQSRSLDILRFCHNQRDDYYDGVDVDKIIRTGKVEIVKYFSDNQGEFSERSTMVAAMHGHLDVLKYLLAKDIDWDVDAHGYHGHYFLILKFGYEKYRQWFNSNITKCFFEEKSNFNVDMLKYLRQNNCPWGAGAIYI
ncbi:hypothetical protein CTEN210_12726 [Chaetoceros tenuissimus]|uniref:Uncharacterized protein n=1 Tax=Chaetoceros tenuissimus TaxID=426638 RepID=A0AAD3D3X3_9STRA|nr:hypothetical protein CTEN210_12726 [Chaetoceros tenuissimus]